MFEIFGVLKSKSKLRRELKGASVLEIERVIKNLGEILDEHKREAARLAEEQTKKREVIEKLKIAMAEAGVQVEDLLDNDAKVGRDSTNRKVESKYAVVVDGARHEWTGRGRTPKVFKEYMTRKGIEKKNLPKA